MLKWKVTVFKAFLLMIFLTTMASCSKQEFVRQQYSADGGAIGFRYLPAKVDIVLVPDNTGSVTSAFSTLQSQFSSFASNLQSQYWDYHVMRSLLFSPSPINIALVNPQYSSSTLADGSPNPATDLIASASTITDPSRFTILNASDLRSDAGSVDWTMLYTVKNLSQTINTQNHFIRDDAILVIVIITNGIDGDLVQYANQPQDNPVVDSYVASWASKVQHLKTDRGYSSQLIRFFPVVSANYRTNDSCYGRGAYSGAGYISLLNYIKGQSFEFCDQTAMNGVFNAIAANLNVVRQSYVYSRIVLSSPPYEASISIFKNGQALPKDSSNGWTYDGYGSVYTITGIRDDSGNIQPVNANIQTGYVITLHGSGQMMGSDTPSVNYEIQ